MPSEETRDKENNDSSNIQPGKEPPAPAPCPPPLSPATVRSSTLVMKSAKAGAFISFFLSLILAGSLLLSSRSAAWFLDSRAFMTRDRCGRWDPRTIQVYCTANALIAAAYIVIPASLAVLWLRLHERRALPRPVWAIPAFVMFIVSCGVGHFCQVLAFFWPAYRFFTLIDCVTAVASVLTAVILPFAVNRLLDYRSPEEYEEAHTRLMMEQTAKEAARDELRWRNLVLQKEVDRLQEINEAMRRSPLAVGQKEYEEMREAIKRLRNHA